MTRQSETFIELFKIILEDNNYYKEIRMQCQRENMSLSEIAKDLYIAYDNDYSEFGPYLYLDSIENYLRKHKEEEYRDKFFELCRFEEVEISFPY